MDFKSVGKRSDDAATDYGHARMPQERSERGVGLIGQVTNTEPLGRNAATWSAKPRISKTGPLCAIAISHRLTGLPDVKATSLTHLLFLS